MNSGEIVLVVVDVEDEEEHSVSFSVVDARNVVEEVVRIDDDDDASVLWCVENAAAEEHDALTRRAVERILLENFMVDCCLLF